MSRKVECFRFLYDNGYECAESWIDLVNTEIARAEAYGEQGRAIERFATGVDV